MKQLTSATEKLKRSRLSIKAIFNLSLECKLLFALLALMVIRLVSIIAVVVKEFHL